MTAPESYRNAGTFMLIAGASNIAFGAIGMLVFTLFFLPCCLLALPPIGWGIVEVIFGWKLRNGDPVPIANMLNRTGLVIGALSSVFGIGVVPLALEVAAFFQLNAEDSREYLESLNSMPAPTEGGG
jgi:hypothetical protein